MLNFHRALSAPVTLMCFVGLLTDRPRAQQTILVPQQQPTIQAGLDAAMAGDTVLVAPGTYFENIEFRGLPVVLRSAQGPQLTTIDGMASGPVVTFDQGETRGAVIEGFTITNGRGGEGGGITVQGASPTIRGNDIVMNQASSAGGGIGVGFASPLIERNRIRLNSRSTNSGGIGGGGISLRGAGAAQILDNEFLGNDWSSADGGAISMFAAGTPLIRGNRFIGNTCSSSGGALSMVNFSDATIVQNLFVGNRSTLGSAIYWLVPASGAGPRVVNNTFVGNQQGTATIYADGFDAGALIVNNVIVPQAGLTGVFCGNFTTEHPIVRSNNVFAPPGQRYGGDCPDVTGIAGNISADPRFEQPGTGDYRLLFGSPCVDAGDNTAPSLPPNDPEGEPRIIDGDGNGTATVDIGVDEYSPLRVLGEGCEGPAGFEPVLTIAGGLPIRGNTAFAAELSGAFGGANSMLLTGLTDEQWNGVPLPLVLSGAGLPQCTLFVAAQVCIPVPVSGSGPGGGTAALPLPVPRIPALAGLEVFLQWFVFPPASGGPAALSAGLRAQIL